MKSKFKSGFYVTAVILSFLALAAILYSYYEETGNEVEVEPQLRQSSDNLYGSFSIDFQTPLRQDYENLLGTFPVEYPGRGKLDYPGNVSADYAKSYAMFLSAELFRAKSMPDFQLSESGKNAGYWLLNNADADRVLGH